MPGLKRAGGTTSPRERAAIVQNVVSGALSVREVCERHELSTQCVVDWVTEFRRASLQAFDARLRQTLEGQGIAAPIDVGAPHFALTLGELALPDLIQIMALGRRDGLITIAHDGAESRLWFVAGEVVDAESGKLQASAAVYRMLALEHGRITTTFTADVNRPCRVRRSTMQLLLEGARRADECNAAKSVLGTGYYRLAPGVPARDARLPDAERAVSSAFAAPSTIIEALAESTLGDLETLSLIKRWVSSEYLVPDPGFQRSRALPVAAAPSSHAPQVLSLASAAPGQRTERTLRALALSWGSVMGLVLGVVAWALLPKPLGSRGDVATAAPLPSVPQAALAAPVGGGAPTMPVSAVDGAIGAEGAARTLPLARPLDSLAATPAATAVISRTPLRSPARDRRRPADRAPLPAASALGTPAATGVTEAAPQVPRMRIIEDQVPKLRVVE